MPGRNVMAGFDERDIRLQLLAKPVDALRTAASRRPLLEDYEGKPPRSSIAGRSSARARQPGAGELRSHLAGIRYDEDAEQSCSAYRTGGVLVVKAALIRWAESTLDLDYRVGADASGFSRGDTDGGAAADFGGVAPNICSVGCGESHGKGMRGLDQWSEEVRIASQLRCL